MFEAQIKMCGQTKPATETDFFFKEDKNAVETNSKQLWRQTGSFNLTGNQLLKLQTDYLFYKIKNKLEPNYNVDKNNDHHHFNSLKKKWSK